MRTEEPPQEELGREEETGREEEGAEEVRRLLALAGPRPELPAQDLGAIRAAARAAWRQGLASLEQRDAPDPPLASEGSALRERHRASWRPARRLWVRAAVFGALALAASYAAWRWHPSPSHPSLPSPSRVLAARVERLRGATAVSLSGQTGGPSSPLPLAEGQPVYAGSLLTTADRASSSPGGVALRLAGGASLRLDVTTTIRLASPSRIELEHGAVYVDNGGAAPGGAAGSRVAIRTPLATVEEAGTQFSVRWPGEGQALEVRVREGEVRLAGGAASASAGAGSELLLAPGGELARRPLAAHGAEWEWVLDTAPRFAIEGRTLGELLAWVSRETGWKVRIDDRELAAATPTIVLHGDTAGLRPDRAALVVLAGAGLRGEVVDGTLVIRRR